MHARIARWAVSAAICLVGIGGIVAPFARGGQASTAPSNSDDRLNRVEERLAELEARYKADMKSRDEEIARLKSRLEPGPKVTTTKPSAEAGLIDEIDAAGPARPSTEQTSRDVAQDADRRSASPLSLSRNPVSFNPDLAVVSDLLGSYSSHRANDALNRIDVREVELDLRAAVDPRADGVAILAFARDVENPVFPNAGEPAEGPDTSVDIEEAYLFLHDFGVPNLTAKLGRFHVRFGRQNILHLHDLPTSDPPLVNQAFLAPEALTDSGLSLSYVIPPAIVGNQYIEIVEEILAGEGAGAESPTLRGDLSVDSPAFNTHILWNTDIARDWNLELGASWLTGHADADNAHDVNLYGVDATLIHTDPTGRFFNQLFQAEAIYGDTYDEAGIHRNGWGAYCLAQQQLNRDWFTGVRLDYTEDPNSDHARAWAVSPYVSWYWSEFLRLRLEYQHKDGDVPSEDNLYFQATWIFGAHPPHPYWAMR